MPRRRASRRRGRIWTGPSSEPNPGATLSGRTISRSGSKTPRPIPMRPKVISAATEFLRKYPGSPFVPDVRMKLAETYYRRQDFPNAQTHFQILAQENPRGPFTERALFFAAKSATQSMAAQSLDRALVLLDEVVKRNGELKWAARNEQAAIERKLGKNQDATTLYDEVCKGTPSRRKNARHFAARATFCMKPARAESRQLPARDRNLRSACRAKGCADPLAKPGSLQEGNLPGETGRSGKRARGVLQDHRGRKSARPAAAGIFLVL